MRRGFPLSIALAAAAAALLPARGHAQEPATLAAGSPIVQGALLAPGTDTFAIVFLQDGQERGRSSLVEELREVRVEGRALLQRVQTVRRPDGGVAITDSVLVDPVTLAPIRHRSHAPVRLMALDFDGARVTGRLAPREGAAEEIALRASAPLFDSNTVDLVLRALPLATGFSTRIPFYLHEQGGESWMTVRVTGTERVEAGGRGVEAWVVVADRGGRETTYRIARESRLLLSTHAAPQPGREVRIERPGRAAGAPARNEAAAGGDATGGSVLGDRSAGNAARASGPAGLVLAALEAMGGEARLRAIEGVRLEGIGHVHYLEQSERFEGPWIPSYEQFSELRDLRGGRMRRTAERRDYNFAQFTGWTTIVADGVAAMAGRTRDGESRVGPGQPASVAEAADRLTLSPERVLLHALDAPDLRAGRDTLLFGVPHHTVSFGYRGGSVRLFLNARSALPSMLETRLAYPEEYFWDVWGDVTMRTTFTFWTLEPGGLRYPRTWSTEWDGKPYRTVFLTAVDLAAAVPADSFQVPAEVRAAFQTRLAQARGPKAIEVGERWGGGGERRPARELQPGLVFLPGGYNVVLARQPDGIVVIEAPFSSEYTGRILAEVERRFPGEKVKAVVSTGDAWTYVGGVREYAARGLPVYALDLNRPVLEKVVRARHTIDPDALERAPRRARFHWVGGKTVVGSGPNRMEIYPIRGFGGERMLMVYFPEHRLLWGADLVQGPRPDGTFFMPQYLSELVDAVAREGLEVETVVAMHAGPIPWARVAAAVERVMRPAAVTP